MLLLFFAVFEIITAVHGFQFLDEFAVGNGFAEVVALDPFAASLLEEAELLGGFHAFGQGVYVEGLGEHDHGSDDFLGFVAEVPHEAHVDLDFVEVEVTQGSERGIGAAEVVHQDFIAGFAEECHLFFDLGRIGHQGGLGDFHAEHFRLEVVFLNGFLEFFVRIAGLEVGSGEVEGNGHDWCAFFDAFPEVSGNLTDDVNVELVGEVRCFEDGDEFARHHEACFRRIPSGKALGAAEFPCPGIDLWLVVDFYFMVLERIPDIQEDEAQIQLAEFVKCMHKKGAKIVVSNSDPKNTNTDDDFFDNIYSAHTIKRVEATRMINCNGKSRGKIKELLISNF